jgi:type II secretory pathway pseudopilin PulG
MLSPLKGDHCDARQGFTLVELLVSFGALLIVLLGFSRMLLSSQMASNTSHEATIAKEAARSMLEVVQAAPFGQIYALYNSNPADDPGGVVAPGASFAVNGLEAPEGDADGMCGLILFPEQGGALREDLVLPELFGSITDLNGDGNTDALDHAGDYRLLPVAVRVEWRSAGGSGRIEFKSVIGDF